MKRAVILQPSYLPWLGYFDQMQKSDVFIFYDDVLYTKNDWRNRNKIKGPAGTQWLTVPVEIKNRTSQNLLIKNALIKDQTFVEKHLSQIIHNYKKASFFQEVFELVNKFYVTKNEYISMLDINTTLQIAKYLGINHVTFKKSSELNIYSDNPSQRLVDICKSVGATHYLTGGKAKEYLEESRFHESGIVLEYQNYHHPNYHQLWGEFVPYLSVIDLLFNEGNRSLKILTQ